MRHERSRNKILGSRAAVLLGAVILAIVVFGSARELYQNYLLQKEISALEEEASRLEKGRLELLETVERIGSGEFLEDEARLGLGLQLPGEQVVVVKGKNGGAGSDQKELSNPRRWLNYFVGEDEE